MKALAALFMEDLDVLSNFYGVAAGLNGLIDFLHRFLKLDIFQADL